MRMRRDALAREIARAGWARRDRFRAKLTTLEDAVALAKGTADTGKPPLIFADVADNPGGGGRGNTMWILQAFHAAGVTDAIVGVIHDPSWRPRRMRAATGARFMPGSTATGATNFPIRSPRRPWCGRCATPRCAAGAASSPITRSILAPRPRWR